jgi:hypothetical protein
MERYNITRKDVKDTLDYADNQWNIQLAHKGDGIFVSSHEILGVLIEEIREFENAIQSNDLDKIGGELTDILIVALHGLASINSKKMDWPK